jgi:hypothetical protein
MNRRGLLQGATVIIPFLSGFWSWVHGVEARPDRYPASGQAIRDGRPKRTGTGLAARSGDS